MSSKNIQQHVPIQRLIISLSNSSFSQQKNSSSNKTSNLSSNSIANTLIRNCQVPQTDLQVGADRLLGFTDKISHNARGRKLMRGVKKRDVKRNENLFKIQSSTAKRSWNRPFFEDFWCSLYCDRLMLGEPPIRTALVCPYLSTFSSEEMKEKLSSSEFSSSSSSSGMTFDSVCKILQQFQTLEPEDILLVVEEEKEEEKVKSPEIYLGPIPEKLLKENLDVNEVVEAIRWRFIEKDDDEEEKEVENEDDPIEYVSCLLSENKNDNNESDLSLQNSAAVSALWCSHPDAAAMLAQKFNSRKSINDGDDDILSSRPPLFQFSMIRLRDEKILEAERNPHLARAIVPGMAPTELNSYAARVGEQLQVKMKRDEKIRESGRKILEDL